MRFVFLAAALFLPALALASPSESAESDSSNLIDHDQPERRSFVFECFDVLEIEGARDRYRFHCVERDGTVRIVHIARTSDETGASNGGDITWFHDQSALINITQTVNAFVMVKSSAPSAQTRLKVAGVYSKRPLMKGELAVQTATLLLDVGK